MLAEQVEQWLLSLPLEEPCEIDGESVYLRLGDGGAELGLVLVALPTGVQVAEALRSGFQGALEFDAGLALSAESGDLVLNRWLDGVEAWSDVPEALEGLLNQAALWRAAIASEGRHAAQRAESGLNSGLNSSSDSGPALRADARSRAEQRARQAFNRELQ